MFLLNLVFHNNKDEKIWSNSNNVSKSEEMVSSFLLVLDVYSRGLVISWISAGVQPSLAYLVQCRIAQPHNCTLARAKKKPTGRGGYNYDDRVCLVSKILMVIISWYLLFVGELYVFV